MNPHSHGKPLNSQAAQGEVAQPDGGILVFDDLTAFSEAVKTDTGLTFDFVSLASLNTNLVESTDQYMVLTVRGYENEEVDVLFLTQEKAFLYSKSPPPREAFRAFAHLFPRPFGRSTALAFLSLDKTMDDFKPHLEEFTNTIRELETTFDYAKWRKASFDLELFDDRLEEFHDLLLKLEERPYKQVEARYISFDYRVLIAESLSMQQRVRRRLVMLRDLARDYETQVNKELNKRIERLNDIVKRLTALTVIFMIPTLIASHFGMNFAFMPELRVPWAYPTVIISQIILVGTGVFIFKKIGWL